MEQVSVAQKLDLSLVWALQLLGERDFLDIFHQEFYHSISPFDGRHYRQVQ